MHWLSSVFLVCPYQFFRMAASGCSSVARPDRVRSREQLLVCCAVAFIPVLSWWQAVVDDYLAVPQVLQWGPHWFYDRHSRMALAGAHELVIEGVVQQESGNLCYKAEDMSKALTRLAVLSWPVGH